MHKPRPRVPLVVIVAVAVLGFGCGPADPTGAGYAPPFALSGVSPADGASDAPFGTTAVLYFTRAPDTVALGAGLLLSRDTQALPVQLQFHGMGGVTISAPLIPGAAYAVSIPAGLPAADGSTLVNPILWRFATRPWTTGIVSEPGTIGFAHATMAGPDGTRHLAYYNISTHQVMYARCPARCGSVAGWERAAVGQVGFADRLALALTPSATYIAFSDGASNLVRVAACTAGCTLAGSWSVGAIGTGGLGGVALAALGDSLHIAYTASGISYRTCGLACADSSNWSPAVELAASSMAGEPAIATAPHRRVAVAYIAGPGRTLHVRTCLVPCSQSSAWSGADDVIPGAASYPSIAVGRDGSLHLAYEEEPSWVLGYATCPARCTSTAAWNSFPISSVGGYGFGTSIVLDSLERIHLSSADVIQPLYATCASRCESPGSWDLSTPVSAQAAEFVRVGASLAGAYLIYRDNADYALHIME